MNIQEYEQVKNLSYWEYCDYLQNKYGLSSVPYMTKDWYVIPKCIRGQDGLFAHHKAEIYRASLSDPYKASDAPYEWQTESWIVYCDYLEHLLLHIMIIERPELDGFSIGTVGLGVLYIIPDLMKLYSGVSMNSRKQTYFNRVITDKLVFLELLKRLYSSFLISPMACVMYGCPSVMFVPIGLNSLIQEKTCKRKRVISSSTLLFAKEIWEYTMPYDSNLQIAIDYAFNPQISYFASWCESALEDEQLRYQYQMAVINDYCNKYPGTNRKILHRLICSAWNFYWNQNQIQ